MEASTAALGVIAATGTPTGQIAGGTTLSGGTTPSIAPVSSSTGKVNANSGGVPPITYHRLSPGQVRSWVSPF